MGNETRWLSESVRSNGKRVVVWVVALLLVAGSGFVLYFGTPLHGREASIDTVSSNPAVTITQSNDVYAIEPADGTATAGLVFYPGGRVHPDAYLASLAPLAARADVAVYVPRMPLNLAVLDSGRAESIISDHPTIDRWFVGGHSLGGVMACRYANSHSELSGLVLFASYCTQDVGTIDVLSVTGSADAVLDEQDYRQNRVNLPSNATLQTVSGMNHSEFGSYTGQREGQPARIDYATAHTRLANVIVPWIESRTTSEQPSVDIDTR